VADLRAEVYAALEDSPTDHIVTRQAAEELAEHVAGELTRRGWVHEHQRVPAELAGMSAQDRGVWLSVERFYNAALRAEGIERNARSRSAFRELVPDAQQIVVSTLIPVIQMLHQIALNPEARRRTVTSRSGS
jgi:hypothetical protein